MKEDEDIFPSTFSEMKWIIGDLGEMKIQLRQDAKLMKKRTYRLNPKNKEKVQQELDKMFDERITVPIEESKWMSPIVVQD